MNARGCFVFVFEFRVVMACRDEVSILRTDGERLNECFNGIARRRGGPASLSVIFGIEIRTNPVRHR